MNTNTLYALLVAFAVVVVAGGYVFLQAPKKGTQTERTLVVGTNVGYPPFIMTDDTGNVVGFDVDVIRSIADHLGFSVTFKDMSFDALAVAVQQGQVDAVIGGFSVTPERAQKLKLIHYYAQDTPDAALFYPADNPLTIASLDELASSSTPYTICTQAGTIFEQMISDYSSVTTKTLDGISELFLDVSYKKSDACLLDIDSVTSLVAKDSSLAMRLVSVPEQFGATGFAIGVSPRNEQLARDIRSAVTALRNNGVLKRLSAQWFDAEVTNAA